MGSHIIFKKWLKQNKLKRSLLKLVQMSKRMRQTIKNLLCKMNLRKRRQKKKVRS